MTKKRKCATALLATALLSYGFTLDKKEEMILSEAELPKEVVTQQEHWEITEPQYLATEEN